MSNGQLLYPVYGLAHELGHAVDTLDYASFAARQWRYPSNSPLAAFHEAEEYYNITGLETSTLRYFGQPTRYDHILLGGVPVSSPIPPGG